MKVEEEEEVTIERRTYWREFFLVVVTLGAVFLVNGFVFGWFTTTEEQEDPVTETPTASASVTEVEEDEGLTTGQKWLIGGSVTVLVCAAAALYYFRIMTKPEQPNRFALEAVAALNKAEAEIAAEKQAKEKEIADLKAEMEQWKEKEREFTQEVMMKYTSPEFMSPEQRRLEAEISANLERVRGELRELEPPKRRRKRGWRRR